MSLFHGQPLSLKGGTEVEDHCKGVVITDDGSVIVAGETRGDWGGINAGKMDFVAVKLNASGEQIWVWQVSYIRSQHNDRSACCDMCCGTRLARSNSENRSLVYARLDLFFA